MKTANRDEYTLILSREELNFLRDVLGSVGGDQELTRRGICETSYYGVYPKHPRGSTREEMRRKKREPEPNKPPRTKGYRFYDGAERLCEVHASDCPMNEAITYKCKCEIGRSYG